MNEPWEAPMRSARTNGLLTGLSKEERLRLSPVLSIERRRAGETLHPQGEPVHQVYFPIDAVISLRRLMRDGSVVSVALIGPEGLVGLAGLLDGEPSAGEATVLVPGLVLRAQATRLREELERSPAVRSLLLRCLASLIKQVEQFVACNGLHHLRARLACWLLMVADRAGRAQLHLTDELRAEHLAVRRASVSLALEALHAEGILGLTRGVVEIGDRAGLESAACECYPVTRHGHLQLLRCA
jgi:CRP-like cAMP-binding protein